MRAHTTASSMRLLQCPPAAAGPRSPVRPPPPARQQRVCSMPPAAATTCDAAAEVVQLERAAMQAHADAQAHNKAGRFEEAQAAYARMRELDARALELTREAGCLACRVAGSSDAAQRDDADGDGEQQQLYRQLHAPSPWPAEAAGAGARRACAPAGQCSVCMHVRAATRHQRRAAPPGTPPCRRAGGNGGARSGRRGWLPVGRRGSHPCAVDLLLGHSAVAAAAAAGAGAGARG